MGQYKPTFAKAIKGEGTSGLPRPSPVWLPCVEGSMPHLHPCHRTACSAATLDGKGVVFHRKSTALYVSSIFWRFFSLFLNLYHDMGQYMLNFAPITKMWACGQECPAYLARQ